VKLEEQKASQKFHFGKIIRIFLLIAVISTAGFGAYTLYTHLLTSSEFELRDVKINGNNYISKNEILKMSKLENRANIFKTDIREVKTLLLSNPQFKKVNVDRIYPNTIEINVKERTPVAYVGENKNYEIDEDGVIFPAFKSSAMSEKLYLFKGVVININEVGEKTSSVALKQGLFLVDKLNLLETPYLSNITGLDLTCPEEIALLVGNSSQVYKLGVGNWDEKISKLICLLKNLKDRNKEISTIDLRFRDEAVVAFAKNN
jgi:cell division protein FtsQ